MLRARLAVVVALAALASAGCGAPHGRVLDATVADTPPVDTGSPAGAGRSLRLPEGAQAVTVVWHADGDTVRVRATGPGLLPQDVDVPVRLLEIDAPEERPRECLADESTAALVRLLPAGRRAFVVPDEDPVDRYRRHLRYVWNAEGVFVNEAMVRRGFARAVLHEPNDEHIARMRRAEAAAREAGRGLWGTCG